MLIRPLPSNCGNKTHRQALPTHHPIALTLARVLVARRPVSWPGTRPTEPLRPRSSENAMGDFSPIVAIIGEHHGLPHPQPSTPRSHISICDGCCRYCRWLGCVGLHAANIRPKWRTPAHPPWMVGGSYLLQWHPLTPKTINTTINRWLRAIVVGGGWVGIIY